MERAADFLGHRHCLTRTVTHGCRFGRTIGIPTVNLTMPPRVLVPAHGVYITRVYLPDGRSFAGVTNVGTRPTVSDSDAVSVETFLLDLKEAQLVAPQLNGYPSQLVDAQTLEVQVEKSLGITELFRQLAAQKVEVLSLRNKSNRLEELFVSLVEKNLAKVAK